MASITKVHVTAVLIGGGAAVFLSQHSRAPVFHPHPDLLENPMSISIRSFYFGADDAVYALPASRRAAMFKAPAAHPIPAFAGQRIRCAEVIVALTPGRRAQIQSVSCYLIRFDAGGVLDWNDLTALAVSRQPGTASLLNWEPTPEQMAMVSEAALGRLKPRRL